MDIFIGNLFESQRKFCEVLTAELVVYYLVIPRGVIFFLFLCDIVFTWSLKSRRLHRSLATMHQFHSFFAYFLEILMFL